MRAGLSRAIHEGAACLPGRGRSGYDRIAGAITAAPAAPAPGAGQAPASGTGRQGQGGKSCRR